MPHAPPNPLQISLIPKSTPKSTLESTTKSTPESTPASTVKSTYEFNAKSTTKSTPESTVKSTDESTRKETNTVFSTATEAITILSPVTETVTILRTETTTDTNNGTYLSSTEARTRYARPSPHPSTNVVTRCYEKPNGRVIWLNRNCSKCNGSHFDFEHDDVVITVAMMDASDGYDYEQLEDSDSDLEITGELSLHGKE
ncbi:hypothetical protein DFH27DRAFT_654065 [Peziza echinospora]|nr:hypothetical protein DFH27DRAFT_654065 [Peziza echinospora]